MIAYLNGVLMEKMMNEVILDVHGVGYRVNVSTLTSEKLTAVGATVALRIRTVVREDAFDLFGFLNRDEESLFELLTSVSHVGPKMALQVMSGLEFDALVQAIRNQEVAKLTKIHGVGKKTAERLVLELKEKVQLFASSTPTHVAARKAEGSQTDLVSALQNLGYKPPIAEAAAMSAVEKLGQQAAFETLFKEALRGIRNHS